MKISFARGGLDRNTVQRRWRVTQSIITQSLARLAVSRIVIAHRLTTVRQADRIYVLDKGRVAQTGKYDELVKGQGPFAEFAKKQLI